MTFITRFAPSPTGPLHLGHAYSALLAYDMAVANGGRFLLRIEDIDHTRARQSWEQQIYDDLDWLGIRWETPVLRQSDRLAVYQSQLKILWSTQRLFACHCNRRDIQAALSAPQEGSAIAMGPDGPVYPGTCRARTAGQVNDPLPETASLRLAMSDLMHAPRYNFQETGEGPDGATGQITFSPQTLIDEIGDVILARRDIGTSYHLSVVLDDAAQQITHVVRGQDLFEATKIHVLLQHLLNLPTPVYHHHKLIRDETGKRLAKRDDARAIATYRQDGATPQDIRQMVGLR